MTGSARIYQFLACKLSYGLDRDGIHFCVFIFDPLQLSIHSGLIYLQRKNTFSKYCSAE